MFVQICLYVLAAWGVLITILHFGPRFLPLSDRGHRCFSVKDEKTASDILEILALAGGPKELFTFDAGPTHQTLLNDGTTVLIWFDEEFRRRGLPENTVSVAVTRPAYEAYASAEKLRQIGYTAEVINGIDPEDKLVVLTSSAFPTWCIVFRLHAFKMGMPKTRKITTRA